MRVVGIVALAAALAACQTQRPAQQAAAADRPGCPAGTPQIIDNIGEVPGSDVVIAEMLVQECIGGGVYRGIGVDEAGHIYTLSYFDPSAPGAPPTTSDGAPAKPHVIEAKGR